MSAHKVITVNFTENFLQDSKAVVSEADLRLISKIIAENPNCGEANQEIPNLRSLSWPLFSTMPHTGHTLWYLAYPQLPHIEVVAFTANDEPSADRASLLASAWKVFRIGMMLRTLYKGIEFLAQHVHIS